MTQAQRRLFLIQSLLKEQSQYRDMGIPADTNSQRQLLRGLILRLRQIRHPGFRLLTVLQNFSDAEKKLLPFVCKNDFLGSPDDEPDAKIIFQRLDRRGDGGLGNKEFLTGPREISVAVDCIQILQPSEIQHGRFPLCSA